LRQLDIAQNAASYSAKQPECCWLTVLAKRPDREIDYSDIPPPTDAFWKNAVRNPFYKPTKQVTIVRVDSDVLLWLKGQGKGYQTRINAIRREAMLRHIRHKA
jgi:uncharacterized protein (DUF4415 family)